MIACKHCRRPFTPKRREQEYCSRSCASVSKGSMRSGQKTGPQRGRAYKRSVDRDGYIRVYAGNHPFASGRLLILEHVMVMEAHLGRRLTTGEVVHHVNHERTDNRLENLQLMSRSEHSRQHGTESSPARTRRRSGQYA